MVGSNTKTGEDDVVSDRFRQEGMAGQLVTDHPNDGGTEVFFQLLCAIWAVAITQIKGTGSWVLAKHPKKRWPIANGSVVEALGDAAAPGRLTHVDRVQLEVDVDVRLRGIAGTAKPTTSPASTATMIGLPSPIQRRQSSTRSATGAVSRASRPGSTISAYASRQHASWHAAPDSASPGCAALMRTSPITARR
jgi:hypothetical protein